MAGYWMYRVLGAIIPLIAPRPIDEAISSAGGTADIFEVLCDECEAATAIDQFDEEVRREILLMLGAR